MQTSTKLERYNPKVRKKDMRRHIKSPAFHSTVKAHPISNGIMINVTSLKINKLLYLIVKFEHSLFFMCVTSQQWQDESTLYQFLMVAYIGVSAEGLERLYFQLKKVPSKYYK